MSEIDEQANVVLQVLVIQQFQILVILGNERNVCCMSQDDIMHANVNKVKNAILSLAFAVGF